MSDSSAGAPSQRPGSQRHRPVRSALRRSWHLVRGERRGPLSRLLGRTVTLRVGSRRRRTTVGMVSVVAVLLVLSIGSVVVFATPLLGARSVQVVGADELTPDQIRTAANVDDGTPLARLNTGRIEANVSGLPSVAKVSVVRAWPATVRIKVTERRPAAVAQRGGEFVVIDSLGVLYRSVKERPANLPLVKDAYANSLVIPDFATDPTPKKDKALVAAVRVARALTPELSEKLVHIAAPDRRRVSLQLEGGRSVFWGSASETAENVRKATVATVLLARSGRTIDVSTPGVVSVR